MHGISLDLICVFDVYFCVSRPKPRAEAMQDDRKTGGAYKRFDTNFSTTEQDKLFNHRHCLFLKWMEIKESLMGANFFLSISTEDMTKIMLFSTSVGVMWIL